MNNNLYKKPRLPRKLKKAVKRILVMKANNDGTWDVTINLYLKHDNKWNIKANTMVSFNGRRVIFPNKRGRLIQLVMNGN